ncbi:G patch domain and ankyrin repeat-containing protein 1 [Neophaeococcomyces mojaviensis]|uniref:G patch domain and ankyrin repeat-containing protein 1 n=1 Tax=Neophaeococcomyces mojaviensis TaxID=3383035 RepID=A0ACC3A0V1_9EURO|nr:G patch domain and ankyrin repeat-containing protein 1 [Knufia sp. JES_112]
MSQRLRSTAEKIRKDLNLYYLASDFAGNMEISATQLALLSCRNNNTIEPQLCIPSPELDLLGRNIFHIAAETADLTWLRQAIKTTPDILKDYLRERDFMGFTPHMVAAYTGSADVFNFFVKAGCDLKLKDPQGRDALCLASMAGHEMIVSSNIQHGITVQDCFPMHSPIWDAAAANRRPVVELLLENKAEPCFEHDGLRASAIAFKRGHIELSTFLAEKEEQRDKELSSPKHDAIGRGLRTLKRKINEAAHLSRSPSRNGAAGQSQPSPKSATHKRRRSTRSSSQPLETRIDDVNPMSTTQDATDLGELFSDMVDLAGSHYTDPIPAASATFCDSSANLVFTNPTAILPGLDDSWDTLHDQ